MKELYIVWCVIACFVMMSANSKGMHLFSALFSSNGSSSGYYGGYGRGWGFGSGGGFHK